MRKIWKWILPVGVIEIIALKKCERIQLGLHTFVEPFKGTLFEDYSKRKS